LGLEALLLLQLLLEQILVNDVADLIVPENLAVLLVLDFEAKEVELNSVAQ
jgi:hypothetical protein